MRYMILISALLLSGCFKTIEYRYVDVPVWTQPKVNVPTKPLLICDGQGTDGEVVRKIETDMINLQSYATQLENVVTTLLKNPSEVNATTHK